MHSWAFWMEWNDWIRGSKGSFPTAEAFPNVLTNAIISINVPFIPRTFICFRNYSNIPVKPIPDGCNLRYRQQSLYQNYHLRKKLQTPQSLLWNYSSLFNVQTTTNLEATSQICLLFRCQNDESLSWGKDKLHSKTNLTGLSPHVKFISFFSWCNKCIVILIIFEQNTPQNNANWTPGCESRK